MIFIYFDQKALYESDQEMPNTVTFYRLFPWRYYRESQFNLISKGELLTSFLKEVNILYFLSEYILTSLIK